MTRTRWGIVLLAATTATAQIANLASTLNRPRADSFIANGVDSGLGAFVMSTSLLSVQGARTLDFAVQYNSLLVARSGALAPGWTHAYESRITGPASGTVVVHWDALHFNSFRFNGSGQPYTPIDEAVRYDDLVRNSNGSWRLVRQDGTVYEFNSTGRLTRLGDKVGQFLDLSYNPAGQLATITEPTSRQTLSLEYQPGDSGLLSLVRDRSDRIAYFEYDPRGRLTALRAPVVMEPGIFPGVILGKPIPDNNPAGLVHEIPVDRQGRVGLVQLAQANISHERPADLRVFLISPQGTRVEVPRPSAGHASFSGVVLPQFDGETAAGTWRVQIVDTRSGITGSLDNWNMVFTERTDPTRFRYGATGYLTEGIDPYGNRVFANSYDNIGRVILQDDGLDTNLVATFRYEPIAGGGVRTISQDRLGNTHVFVHDAAFHLLSTTDPLDNTTTYRYNAAGDRVSITDPLGRTNRFAYDTEGNLISITDASGATSTLTYRGTDLATFEDPLGNTTTFQYNNGRLTRVTDALDHSDTKSYTGSGQVGGILMSDGAGITYGYEMGRPTSATHPGGHGRHRSEYDTLGRLIKSTDPEGFTVSKEYDTRGNLVRETNAAGETTSTFFDRLGRVSSQVDARGNAKFFEYDGNGNRLSIRDASSGVTRFEYDGEDRIIAIVDANDHRSTMTYDAAGRRVAETDAVGNRNTTEYDEAGQVLAVRDAAGTALARYRYDERGLRIAQTDVYGNTHTSGYDAMGRRTFIRDPLGQTTSWKYDQIDRPIEVNDAAGRTLKQAYEADDVLSDITNARGNNVKFRYGPANRITSIDSDNSGSTVRFTYDGRDRVTRERHPDGVQYDYTYDRAGRISVLTRKSASQTLPTIRYTYDENGNTTAISRGTSGTSLRRTFDAENRVISYTNADRETLRYTYDAVNNLRVITYPDSKQVFYSYDAADRLIQVRDWAGRITRYTWDRLGRITRIAFPNGSYRTMQFDIGGRLVRRREVASNGAVLADYRYTHDALSRITSIQPLVYRGGAPEAVAMTYNQADELTSFNGASVSFDGRGNMTRGPLQGSRAEFVYDPISRLIRAGNTVYEYDDEDRLIGYNGNAGSARLTVNPVNGPSMVVMKRDGDGSVTRYIYGVGLLYEETSTGIRVFHYDHRGNAIAFSGSDGRTLGTIDYGPHGEILAQSGDTRTMFKFGALFGILTMPDGLHYMRFRWHSPETKRFLNRDAHFGDISKPGTLNRYAYGANNPIMTVDPDGEFFNLIAAAVGAVVGVAAALVVRGVSRAIQGRPFVEKGEEWAFAGELAGAALGGAIAGACAGTCGTAALAAYGAVGGLAGNALKQGVGLIGAKNTADTDDDQFNFGEFAIEGALGGLFGALPVGRGAKAIKGRLPKSVKSVFTRQKRLTFLVPTRDGGFTVGHEIVEEVTLTGKILAPVADIVVGSIQGGISEGIGMAIDRATPTRRAVEASARQTVYEGKKKTFGEHVHWRMYQRALEMAGRPLPNVPYDMMAAF